MAEEIKGSSFNIYSEMDVLRARQKAVQLAQTLKFSDIAQAEIEIAVSELGTNIIKHAGARGALSITPRWDQDQNYQGLEISARNGAPCHDSAILHTSGLMLSGGTSTTGTLGIGISGVRRLMDEFVVETDAQDCLKITACKWLDQGDWSRANCSVMARPCTGEILSGDAYYLRHRRQHLLFGVIDGLGHGPEAHQVATIAVNTMDSYQNEPIDVIIQRCHTALTGTRGAAVALGRLDYATRRLLHLSIGNIETRIYSGDTVIKPMLYHGTLGVVLPTFRTIPYPFKNGMLLVMFSDGISNKFELEAPMRRRSPQEISQYILDNFSRKHDDCTVMVIK